LRNAPRVGLTLGDPGGIGPEILIKAAVRGIRGAVVTVFGSARVLRHHARRLHLTLPPGAFRTVDIDNVPRPYFGRRPEVAGPASIAYLDAAFEAYRRGEIDALVTGPINKESWHQAGCRCPGQTEFCAEQTGAKNFCMLMTGRVFRIALLSTHLSLREALRKLTPRAVMEKGRLVDSEFRRLGIGRPRIACAAVNPHAGESGAFGTEEIRVLTPALERLRGEGIAVEGPIAPEVLFRQAALNRNRWDVILAMYHDQAMIPLKLIDFRHGTNVTLGLPLIRTSPDHGTAFDIVGKGVADPSSLVCAIRLASDWTKKRWKSKRN
jgi:4-hydroxythreonine-4-phosphate dehydrogenase